MNRQIRSIINKHAHQKGLKYGLMLRAEMLNLYSQLERDGKSLHEILKALGVEWNTSNDESQDQT